MTITTLTSRTLRRSAKRRLAASSVAHVASGYARSLRPGEARFSRSESAICSGGDL